MAEATKSAMIADLVSVQANLPHIKKEATANYGTYASLDLIHQKILPVLTKNNFAWVTLPSINDTGEPTLKYALKHTSGEEIAGEMKLFIAKQDAQGQGSAITYAKRYAICAVLGLTPDNDDDGAAAVKDVPKDSDPYTAPEEPSRQINDVPITNLSLTKVKRSFAEHHMGGIEVTKFCDFIIGKPSPTTESDATELLKALDAK